MVFSKDDHRVKKLNNYTKYNILNYQKLLKENFHLSIFEASIYLAVANRNISSFFCS